MAENNVAKLLHRKVKPPKKLKPPKLTPLKLEDLVTYRRPRIKRPKKVQFYGHTAKLALSLSLVKASEEVKAKIFGNRFKHYVIRHSIPIGRRPPKFKEHRRKYTQSEKAKYRKFGYHVGLHVIKRYAELHGHHWQVGLANFIVNTGAEYHRLVMKLDKSKNLKQKFKIQKTIRENPELSYYQKNIAVFDPMRSEAQKFREMHMVLKSPKLDKIYFWALHGRAKVLPLSKDVIYKQLLELKKTATNKTELKKFEGLLRTRRRELNHYVAIQEYKRYLMTWAAKSGRYKDDPDRLQIYQRELEASIKTVEKLSEYSWRIGNWVYSELERKFMKEYMTEREETFKEMHNFLKGEELQEYLAKSKDDRPYRGLIQWLITCLDNDELLDIDSSNKWALRRSDRAMHTLLNDPDLLRKFNEYAARNGSPQTGAELRFSYFYGQFGNPAKTSRSGVKYPGFQGGMSIQAWRSQGKYIREYPQEGSGFPGIKNEAEEAYKFSQKWTERDKMAFKAVSDITPQLKSDFQTYLRMQEMSELMNEAIENRKKMAKDKRVIRKKVV